MSEASVGWSGCVVSLGAPGAAWVRAHVAAGDAWRRAGGGPVLGGAGLPLHAAYRTATPRGWPQLILSVYGLNCWGSEVILGYGRIHLPTAYGERRMKIPLFKPRPTTMFAEFMSWITGKSPQLVDPTILAEGNENYLLRTKSCGYAEVTMSMTSKGLKEMNYDNVPGALQHSDVRQYDEMSFD